MRVSIFILIFAATCATVLAAVPAKKFRVLIIDGQNNHDWPPATRWLKTFLERSGRCSAVDVSTTPPKDGGAPTPGSTPAASWDAWRPRFSDYDVVISNFNGGHQPNATRWPAEVERAFEDYVRGGGGFVSFHAANNAFLGWPAYNEMVGLLWRAKEFGPSLIIDADEKVIIVPAGQGRNAGHPPRYTFQMTTLATGHPIARDFPKHWMHPSEQLTHGQHGPESAVKPATLTVLTYAYSKSVDERQPMDWVRAYGKGRVYVTMHGHTWKNEEPDNPNLRCAGFQTLFLRGVEWAATGGVTVPMPTDFPTAEKVSVRAE